MKDKEDEEMKKKGRAFRVVPRLLSYFILPPFILQRLHTVCCPVNRTETFTPQRTRSSGFGNRTSTGTWPVLASATGPMKVILSFRQSCCRRSCGLRPSGPPRRGRPARSAARTARRARGGRRSRPTPSFRAGPPRPGRRRVGSRSRQRSPSRGSAPTRHRPNRERGLGRPLIRLGFADGQAQPVRTAVARA